MTTQTMLKKVANTVSGISAALSNTLAEQSREITKVAREAFGRANWEIPKADLTTVVNAVADQSTWKGTKAEGARRSEVAALVVAYPFLGTACDVFKREFGQLRREHMIKIARLCPDSATASDAAMRAVEFYETRAAKKGTARKGSIGMAIGIIKNLQDDPNISKRKLINFRKDLAALCEKHGISY